MPIHDEKAKGIVLPPEIAAAGFDFPREIERIWAVQKELPVEEISIDLLVWHLQLPFFWRSKEEPFTVKPIDVINNPNESEAHTHRYQRIMSVNTSFPIAIIWWRGKWQILDGLHRLCQLYIKDKKTIKVTKLPVEWIDRIKPE